MAMTAPGQTTGVSVFIDPLIADLGISRTQVSTAYLTGTLVGACAMPFVGRAIDRYGPRRVIALIGAAFGAILIGLSSLPCAVSGSSKRPAPPQTPVSGRVTTRSAASWSPARAAAMERTCS